MRWLAILSIVAVFGSISSAENYNNFGGRLQAGNFNPLYNKPSNFGSIRQPSGHWHYRENFEDEDGDFEEETTDDLDEDLDGESDLDLAVDSDNDQNLEDGDEIDGADQDFGLDKIEIDARRGNNSKSISGSLVNRQSQVTTDDQTINSSVNESATSSDAAEENLSNIDVFGEGFGNEISHLNSQSQSGDFSNLFEGLLGSALLSSSLNKNIEKSLGGGSFQNRGGIKLNGDLSSLFAGILASSIPKSTLSNSLNKGVSKIGNIRNSVLDFRDRALDQRVGTAQHGELNQFDPIFQASLSNPSDRGSTGVDQLTWNSLKDLVTKIQTSSPSVQPSRQGTKTKNGLLGLLGSGKGALTSNKGSEGNVNNSSTIRDEDSNQSKSKGLLGLLGNLVSNKKQDDYNDSSNRGSKFEFLTNAKNFAVNPVGFVERKIRNKIKQKIKNEIKQSVSDITNRVDNFKSNMTGLAGELVESFKSKPSVKRSKNCLKILIGPQAHHLYLNGKQIPQARIFYVDKIQPLDFNSCPINHQDEVLKNCLYKGNVLVLSQPDKVKVEEEHGRQLEMIIAKDVVKDRLNGMVDKFFQNFGRQVLKGVHIIRGDRNE